MGSFFRKNARSGALLVNLIAGMLGAFTMIAHQAWADWDGDPATEDIPRVVPYRGVLDLNGEPVNRDMDMRFALFEGPEGGDMDSGCQAPCRWREVYRADSSRAVRIYNGQFTVNLGELEPIDAALYEAGGLWLGIEVKEVGAPAWVALGNRQRITPVPYALWSRQTSDLDVKGALVVDNGANVAGGFDVSGRSTLNGDTTVNGDLDVSDTIQGNQLRTSNGRIFDQGGDVVLTSVGGILLEDRVSIGTNSDDNLVIPHRTASVTLGGEGFVGPHGVVFLDDDPGQGFQLVTRTAQDALVVEDVSDESSLLRIHVEDGVEVGDDLEVGSDLEVGGDLEVQGTIRSIEWDFEGEQGWDSNRREFRLIAQNIIFSVGNDKSVICALSGMRNVGPSSNSCEVEHNSRPDGSTEVRLLASNSSECRFSCLKF